MKKLVSILALVSFVVFASTSLAWSGEWSFEESCTEAGLIDVTATYTPSDEHGGTVKYTSPHTDLEVGAEVTVELEEDANQHSSYTVTNTDECTPPCETCECLENCPEEEEPPTSSTTSGSKRKTKDTSPPVVIVPPQAPQSPTQPSTPILPRTGVPITPLLMTLVMGLAGGFILGQKINK